MGLPSLYSQPSDAASWRAWSFNHAANHYDMLAAAQAYQQASVTLATTATTTAGNAAMEFAAVNGVRVGMEVADLTNSAAIVAGAVVTGFNASLVQISIDAAQNINTGDDILFAGLNSMPLAQYILDPMNPNDLGMWNYQHQIMHNQLNALLGTQGFDLLSLDWQDPAQFAEWLRLNGDEHTRLSAALRVG